MRRLSQQIPSLISQRRDPKLAYRRSLERVMHRTQPEERLSSMHLAVMVVALPWMQKITAYMRVIRTIRTFHRILKVKEAMFGTTTITWRKSRIHRILSNQNQRFLRSQQAR